ncbi:MAG: hypothetical protein ACK5I7_07410 [Anaerotignum sp.]
MNATFEEINSNLQKKFYKMNELQDLTKQMGQMLQINDLYAFGMIMKMRTEAMIEIENFNYAIDDLLETMSESDQMAIRNVLQKPLEEKKVADEKLQQMLELSRRIARCLERTIELDKPVNMKIAGKKSFYNK